ncbi:MAG TPA: hypothetical protein VND93_17320 [Myxococcales bacterium]|nr:hypothetical protein [Myxococcales bacterium]
MKPITWIACLAITALAACASAPPTQLYHSPEYKAAAQAEKSGADPSKLMICEQTLVTGSHIPTKHCWTKLEMDVARERAQKAASESNRLDH